MKTKRPVILTIAAICLVVLVLFSSVLTLASNFGLLGMNRGVVGLPGGRMIVGGGQGNFQPGGFNGQQPGDLPGNGTDQFPGNFDPNNPTTQQDNPNFQGFQGRRAGGFSGLFGVLRGVMVGLNIVALALGMVAAIGLWKQKKWGAVLAIILAALLLLTSFSGLLRFFSLLVFGEALFKVVLALAVIILLLLPAARKAYAPAPDDDMDLDI